MATGHQTIKYRDGELPVWHEASGNYLDPATGELLPTWDQALDAIGDDGEPLTWPGSGPGSTPRACSPDHATPAGASATSPNTSPSSSATATRPPPAPRHAHADRLVQALRYEPCSPRCANWLRYGIQPKNPRPGLRPGYCRGKAHRREHLGYAGRRVLVSRKWSGKTLADHRADRKAWLLATLGIPDADPARYTWEPVTPGDPDHMPPAQRLLHVVADRQRWHAALAEARRRANAPARSFGNCGLR